MAKGKIKVGIAGLGRSGWDIHQALIGPLTDLYQIVAVFDKDEARMKEANAKYGCAMRGSFKELVNDPNVELVVNATPNKLHAKYSVEAMKAGKDVVCEKPMAVTLDSAKNMIECSKRTKRVLAPFQNRRYAYDFVKVREIIESGVLGRVVQVRICFHGFSRRWDWQTLKKNGGGTLNNTGPHPLDQAVTLFGPKEPNVFCLRDKTLTLGDADDHDKVILYGAGSPTIEVEMTAANAYPQDNWLVMGTQGSLTGTFTALKWKYFDPKKLPKREVEDRAAPNRGYNSEKLEFIEGSWTQPDDAPNFGRQFYVDLHRTIREGKPLHITPESVLRQMKVLEKCRKMAPV